MRGKFLRGLVVLALVLVACNLGSGSYLLLDEGVITPTSIPLLSTEAVLTPAASVPTQVPETQPPPSAAPSLAPTPTPAPTLRQLTSGGCCGQPFWSPDGSRLLFIDRPAPDAASGLWGVGLDGGAPELFSGRLGIYSNDMLLLAYPENGQTVVERLADGQRWTIPNGGRAVSFSPDGTRVAWTGGQDGPPFDTARREVWVSQANGEQARQLASMIGGGFSGWLPDGRLLVSDRPEGPEEQTVLYILSPEDGSLIEIARASRLRGASLSPQGTWLAYQVTFDPDPARNGLWLVNMNTGEHRRLDLFGAYRWRDDGRLLVIPLDMQSEQHRLWQVDAASGQYQPLTDPAVTPFKIANGDWTVSPDGRSVAFVSAADYNIWLLELGQD